MFTVQIYRRMLEAWNFGFKIKRGLITSGVKTKMLISFAVTERLICIFVFANVTNIFSYDVSHINVHGPYIKHINKKVNYHHFSSIYMGIIWEQL